jgi:hypothetical protein
VWIKDKFGEVKRNNEPERKRVLDLLADKIIDLQIQYDKTSMKTDVKDNASPVLENLSIELLHEEARLVESSKYEVLSLVSHFKERNVTDPVEGLDVELVGIAGNNAMNDNSGSDAKTSAKHESKSDGEFNATTPKQENRDKKFPPYVIEYEV